MRGASHRSLVKHRRARRKVARAWSQTVRSFEWASEGFEMFTRTVIEATAAMGAFRDAWKPTQESMAEVRRATP